LKVCILAAGIGSRNTYSKVLPKGFLPINNQPGLTHLIDSIDDVEEIIIAVGSRGSVYKEFLPLLYPEIKLTYVDIENYDGPGSGPGLSLLNCSKYLDSEFILLPTDAYINEDINDSWDKNWMGVSKVSSTRLYCLLQTNEKGYVNEIFDKNPDAPVECLQNGFNGIAFIKDFDTFFESLENDKSLIGGEIQVSNGFRNLMTENNGPGLTIKRLDSWHDFGSNEKYISLIKKFENQNLIKDDEFTYIYKNKVYKYNVDEDKTKNKIYRAKGLKNLVPKILDTSDHFFSYSFTEGNLLSEENNEEIYNNFLLFCKEKVFNKIDLNENDKKTFKDDCLLFYKDKTLKRVSSLLDKEDIENVSYKVNGINCRPIKELLESIDWDSLSNGIPYSFHGDFQPENILHSEGTFTLIDWRESFGNSLTVGDIYYDLAKLNHGLILNGEIVRNNNFDIQINNNSVKLEYLVRSNLIDLKELFDRFIVSSDFDIKRVELLTALIYLNISPLYEGDYSKFLFFLGLNKLQQLS
jgi:NDP-sugar pyrophosphorylase family protein